MKTEEQLRSEIAGARNARHSAPETDEEARELERRIEKELEEANEEYGYYGISFSLDERSGKTQVRLHTDSIDFLGTTEVDVFTDALSSAEMQLDVFVAEFDGFRCDEFGIVASK